MIPLLLSFLIPIRALAVDLKELSINYKYFHPSSRDPFFQGSSLRLKEGINLNMNVHLTKCFYWDNIIESKTDPGQYRMIAWNFYLGCEVLPTLKLQYEHRSAHMLDQSSEYRFPVENSIGLVWILYKR